MTSQELNKFFELAIGSKVVCNGHCGIVVKMHSGQLEGMADVKLDRGTVCVSLADLRLSDTRFVVLGQRDNKSWFEIGSYMSRVAAEDAAAAYVGEYNLYTQVVEAESPEHNRLRNTGHYPHNWVLQNDDLLACACGARKIL